MPPESPLQRRSEAAEPVGDERLLVSDETLVLRNYDSETTHEVTVEFHNADDEIAFQRTCTLTPQAVTSIRTRLPRAVYRVDVRIDGADSASADCLVGSAPSETALVEVGNGLVSVAEGVY
ncbi:hypothetical protein [Halorientalis regularis]|jgi:hypothetical protein|uniref:Ig-like domain-containing protein n=1 Tax=Halorientalis regularis TaxID=660518 RepID=A0A1G7JCN7_9EURY|nr:hypothetical protein [Halorientalis regularis]SDF22656.1 hypothetical protein SAMN05216218_104292 [Halorientalis regularis]